MKTYIISSAPIQYEIPPYDLYDSFDLVSKGKLKAPLLPEARKIIRDFNFPFDITSVKTILTAEGGQTFETAQLIVDVKNLQNVKIIQTPNLNGVRFNMDELVSKKELMENYEETIIRARKMFVTKFFNNELLESRESVIKRMAESLFQLQGYNNAICISHSFYMKLLEIYISNQEKFDNLDDLLAAFNPDNKPYELMQGFWINL